MKKDDEIVIVDNPVLFGLCCRERTKEGARVVAASAGKEGTGRAPGGGPEPGLLDVAMAGMDRHADLADLLAEEDGILVDEVKDDFPTGVRLPMTELYLG